jgi:tyrosyl-tRNA synthetase
MSKSTGNYIGLSEDPDTQYGKVMSISDDTMRQWLRYITDWSADDVAQRTKQLDDGTLHPMELKRMLAHDVVGMYHDRGAADAAAERFSAVHQRKDLPDDMPELRLDGPDKTIVDVLASLASVGSRRNARRLVTDGGVEFDGERVGSPDFVVDHDGVLRIGPRRFYKVVGG